jgi:pimeloyl-ACP methyl ester carboxylesterase
LAWGIRPTDRAPDTNRFLEQVIGVPARLLGVSDGAIVALLVGRRRPDLVSRVGVRCWRLHHDGWWPQAIDPYRDIQFSKDPDRVGLLRGSSGAGLRA